MVGSEWELKCKEIVLIALVVGHECASIRKGDDHEIVEALSSSVQIKPSDNCVWIDEMKNKSEKCASIPIFKKLWKLATLRKALLALLFLCNKRSDDFLCNTSPTSVWNNEVLWRVSQVCAIGRCILVVWTCAGVFCLSCHIYFHRKLKWLQAIIPLCHIWWVLCKQADPSSARQGASRLPHTIYPMVWLANLFSSFRALKASCPWC